MTYSSRQGEKSHTNQIELGYMFANTRGFDEEAEAEVINLQHEQFYGSSNSKLGRAELRHSGGRKRDAQYSLTISLLALDSCFLGGCDD